jgi:hypothetical protein
MSIQDKNPADTARRITPPVVFYGSDEMPEEIKDWRARPVPVTQNDAREETESAPKVESAPEPASDSEFLKKTEEVPPPATPAQPPAVKDSGPPKVTNPGKQISSKAPTNPGA